MPKKRYKPEEIVAKLRQVDVHLSQGSSVADAIRQIGVSEVTYYRWRQEFGGLKISQIRRLKELEAENARLWLADGSCMRLRAEHANHVWSYDFVEDRTHDGRKYRMLNLVDEFTRECLAMRVARRLKSGDVTQAAGGVVHPAWCAVSVQGGLSTLLCCLIKRLWARVILLSRCVSY